MLIFFSAPVFLGMFLKSKNRRHVRYSLFFWSIIRSRIHHTFDYIRKNLPVMAIHTSLGIEGLLTDDAIFSVSPLL
jgi:hypothetical protein